MPLMHAKIGSFAPNLFEGLRGRALLKAFLRDLMPKQLALVSSFGLESAVLLHMVSEIAPNTPVIFLDTGKLFPETLQYKDQLINHFGLTNVRSAFPDTTNIELADKTGGIWSNDPDQCCAIRKVAPLQEALAPFKVWITGRKRYHSHSRREIPAVEHQDGQVKLNPLVDFKLQDIRTYFDIHKIPEHPLKSKGYTSIGCAVCTSKPTDSKDTRSGRWAHAPQKTECGIHFVNGKILRATAK